MSRLEDEEYEGWNSRSRRGFMIHPSYLLRGGKLPRLSPRQMDGISRRSKLLLRNNVRIISPRTLKIFIGIAFILLVYQEIFQYGLVSYYWPQFPDSDDVSLHPTADSLSYSSVPKTSANSVPQRTTMKLLLVADPQLIGYENEQRLIGVVSRWDSDRYLSRTFRSAMNHVNPDIVIFLGDLLDEGSTANDLEYQSTLSRFHSIYNTHSTPTIFISGDNDVGGEGMEVVKRDKVTRFLRDFPSTTQLSSFPLSIYWANVFDGSFSLLSDVAKVWSDEKHLTLLLGHHSLLFAPYKNVATILNKVQPELILTGHDHVGRVIEGVGKEEESPGEFRIRVGHLNEKETSFFTSVTPGDNNHPKEFQTPTCSYRMGVPEMGFGVLALDFGVEGEKNVSVRYEVLWLPGRYPQLFVYLGFLLFFLGFYMFSRCSRRFC